MTDKIKTKWFLGKRGEKACFIFFEQEPDGTYSFHSNDETVQKKWIETKTKRKSRYIKAQAIPYVANAAKTFFNQPQEVQQQHTETITDNRNYVGEVFEWFQGQYGGSTPRFETEVTTQGTQVTMVFDDEILSQATAQNQKIARQLCAKQYYEEEIIKAKEQKREEAKNRISEANWNQHPYFALQEYCRKRDINLDFYEEGYGSFVLIVGDEEFSCFDDDGFKRGTKPRDRAQKTLAKMYYEEYIKPLIKKQQEQDNQVIIDRQQKNAKNPNALHKVIISDPYNIDGSTNEICFYETSRNKTKLLDDFCKKSNLPRPTWSSEETGSNTTVFLNMPGLEDTITAKARTLQEAKEQASLVCLKIIDLMQERKMAQADGPAYQDEVKSITAEIDKIKKAFCVEKKQTTKNATNSTPPSEAMLNALKSRFNSARK